MLALMKAKQKLIDPALSLAFEAVGKFPITKVAEKLGRTHSAVSQWRKCPWRLAPQLAALTNGAVTAAELAPHKYAEDGQPLPKPRRVRGQSNGTKKGKSNGTGSDR